MSGFSRPAGGGARAAPAGGDWPPLQPHGLLLAQDRLAMSRQRMANWLVSDPAASGPPMRSGTAFPTGTGAAGAWLAPLRRLPLAAIAIDAARAAWQRHPLRPAMGLATGAVQLALQLAIQPLAMRRPWALVAGAALAGAVLVVARPRRWLARPALLGGVLAPLAAQCIAALARANTPSTHQDMP